MVSSLIGPIYIYSPQYTLLFSKGCSNHRVCKKLCMVRLLREQGKHEDYAHYLAGLCHFILSYLCKQRALSTIRLFFEATHLQLTSSYVLRVATAYTVAQVKRWALQEVAVAGILRPHWKRYVSNRMSVVEILMSSWKLKLMNIQRVCKDLSSHSCVKAGHSCLRNIMSFCKVPGRKTFKRVGRAFSSGLASSAPGYSIWDLSRGKELIEAELKKQLPR